jgi:hypothetical protein
MTFGAKEVMVIAALAFGIVVTGCSSTPDASLAMSPPLRVYNAGEELDCKFCFSRFEAEFYYPDRISRHIVEPARADEAEKAGSAVTAERTAAEPERDSFVSTWTPTLPSFLK